MNNKEQAIDLKLPRIFKRNGREYLDPIREKLIYITPEETVRQKVIYYLIHYKGIPKNTILVEEHLSHYGIKSRKRADIIVHTFDEEKMMHPLLVIECKAPEVYLDEKSAQQVFEYCDLLEADYAMLINGNEQYCFKYDYEQKLYIAIEDIPEYSQMSSGNYELCELEKTSPRIPFEQLQKYLEIEFSNCAEDETLTYIGKHTPMPVAVAALNFRDCLLDESVKMPSGDYGLFQLVEDYGIRTLTYGNSSGGKFHGPYRSFLVNVGENTEIFSIGVSTYWKSTSADRIRTCISVAHDDEKVSHHALQLVMDDNVTILEDKVNFYHHGRIAIGRMGSGKIDELRMFVKDICPELIHENKFYLGSVTNNQLWRLDNPEIINFIINMISYSIIRDIYRDFVKKNKK